jgi:hypothetical protein
MKVLLATVALATLLSSVAHAQYGVWRGGYYRAYAQAPYYRYNLNGRASPYSYSVYDVRGKYLGSDPDPSVRNQLRRDPTQGD